MTNGAYTLTRRGGRGLLLTLPGRLCELLGVKRGDRVVYEITDCGTLEVRRATKHDLSPLARYGAARADRLMAQHCDRRECNHFDKQCQQCGVLYVARRAYQKFCPHCRRLRQRRQWREYWHRKGQLTPSYQARYGKHTLVPTGAQS